MTDADKLALALDALYSAASHIRSTDARHYALRVHDMLAYGTASGDLPRPRDAHFRNMAQQIEHLKLVEDWLDQHGDLSGALAQKNLVQQARESICDYCDAIKPKEERPNV